MAQLQPPQIIPPSEKSLALHALALVDKITLKQFSLEKNACENLVTEKWAQNTWSAMDLARTESEEWLNWKMFSLLWTRLFEEQLGKFPYNEPVHGRPVEYAMAEIQVGEEKPASKKEVQVQVQAQSQQSTKSNPHTATKNAGPKPRKEEIKFHLPSSIRNRPALLDLDDDDLPQYSAIFPASITSYIFEKKGSSPPSIKAPVEAFHEYYKYCAINALLDEKRRIITIWSEPRRFVKGGKLTMEVKRELEESAIFLAVYSNEAWKKNTIGAEGPYLDVYLNKWIQTKRNL